MEKSLLHWEVLKLWILDVGRVFGALITTSFLNSYILSLGIWAGGREGRGMRPSTPLCGSSQITALHGWTSMTFNVALYICQKWIFSAFFWPLQRETFSSGPSHQILTFSGFRIMHWIVPSTQTLSAYWIQCIPNSFSCSKHCLEAKSELLFISPNPTMAGCLHCSSDLAELSEP